MTKRFGTYSTNTAKKPKLDDDDDDEIWDEGLDDEALDKCFELATQVCQDELSSTQTRDVSILPTYNVFKNPIGFSSTQTNTTSIASTSRKPTLYELEAEVQRLKIQNEEKDGEISILRSKIKEAKTVVQVEQQKTTYEWREKLLSTQKEARLTKSELEFKNLEIANLKQQLAEQRRANLDATLNSTQNFVAPEPVVKVNQERAIIPPKKDHVENSSSRIEAILVPVYPLKCITPAYFEDTEENHVFKNTTYKVSRNTIPCLQNQHYNETNFHHKCAKVGDKKISLKCVYPDVLKLVSCTSDQLNSEYCREAVNKVICVAIILLQDLNEFLVEYGTNLKSEDIQKADTIYLLDKDEQCSSNSTTVNSNEIGSQSGRLLEFISQLILYNSDTADFICGVKSLKLVPNTSEYSKLIPHRNGYLQNDCYILKLLLTIVKNIGKYRSADQMNIFLTSVVKLLINVGVLDNDNYVDKLILTLFQDIVFARPGPSIIVSLTSLLKVCSRYKAFVQYLFGKNGKHPLTKRDSKGIIYYTDDACPFCVLGILLQNWSIRTKKMPLEVCYNMSAFIYNTFKTSHWIHHENTDNVCVCLSQLYRLEVEFVFKALEDFIEYYGQHKKEGGHISPEWKAFLQHEIFQKVLNQMNFNNCELIEKYVTAFSQFREIETVLKNEGIFNFTELNTSDELVKIPIEKFPSDF